MSESLTLRMFRILTFLLVLSGAGHVCAQTDTFHLEGRVHSTSLYFQNPIIDANGTVSVSAVFVNGKKTDCDVESTAFELTLFSHGYKVGDSIEIEIIHQPGFPPKLIQPMHPVPLSEKLFDLADIHLEGNQLVWKVTDEQLRLPYIVEQFRWNKWVRVGDVDGRGLKDSTTYRFAVNLHSGKNKFRVRQEYRKLHTVSTEALCKVSDIKPGFDVQKDKIAFFAETLYEIYDTDKNMVLRGLSDEVDIHKLRKGRYFINYDNRSDTFVLK